MSTLRNAKLTNTAQKPRKDNMILPKNKIYITFSKVLQKIL